jgi:hypothetical protein
MTNNLRKYKYRSAIKCAPARSNCLLVKQGRAAVAVDYTRFKDDNAQRSRKRKKKCDRKGKIYWWSKKGFMGSLNASISKVSKSMYHFKEKRQGKKLK